VPRDRESRREERVRAALRVDLGNNLSGTTRDVSASGIFFETEVPYTHGRPISFAIDLHTPGGRMVLNCRGEIVRVEPRNAGVGVAVRILDSLLTPSGAPGGESRPRIEG
jgi:hypothetical protein